MTISKLEIYKSWVMKILIIFIFCFGYVINQNGLFAQTIHFDSDCMSFVDVPIVSTDVTGRNIFEIGQIKIVWDNTNFRWLIKYNAGNMWISSVSSFPNPPTDPSDWIPNNSGCTVMTVLEIVTAEVCDNGIDDDLDGFLDCTDSDCAVNNYFIETGSSAKYVLGQDDFISSTSGTTQEKLDGPSDVALDPVSKKVFVADTDNHRILRYKSIESFLNNQPAESVLGQTDFISKTQTTGANRTQRPKGIHVDHNGALWVACYNGSRILRFDDAANKPLGADADGVLGQPDFVTGGNNSGASGMSNPTEVYVDDNNTLWVSDYTNQRILRFDNAYLKSNGASADGVLGKPDFTTSGGSGSASIIASVWGIVKIDSSLFVADYNAHRILRWDHPELKSNGADADMVIGQPNFDYTLSGSDATKFKRPRGLDTDADNRLYISDDENNRVLIFEDPLGAEFLTPADYVLGQSNYTDTGVGTDVDALNKPINVAILSDDVSSVVAVSDYNNHRIISWGYSNITNELSSLPFILPASSNADGALNYQINNTGLGTAQVDDSATGSSSFISPGICPLNQDSVDFIDYFVINDYGCTLSTQLHVLVKDSLPCLKSDMATSCNETFNFEWFDGAAGFVWPISNGASTITNQYEITSLYGGLNVDVSIDNTGGHNIDYANCGSTGNHFYSATCNNPGAAADCDGDAGTTDGQWSMGCTFMTLGMTSDTNGDEIRFVMDFDVPVKISNLYLNDIDYEGSSTPTYDSWQDQVKIQSYINGQPVNVYATGGSKVVVENNFSHEVTIKSIYDPNLLGGLSPLDPDGHASIDTESHIDSLVFILSNGPEDDGLSDDHSIGISSFAICPKIPENTMTLCSDGIDNDLDGFVDCNDETCNSFGLCPDFDGDGTSNRFDKDDDNDGLSDEAESSDLIIDKSFGWTHNTPIGTTNMDYTGHVGIDSWFGQNYSMAQSNNITYSAPSGYANISDIESITFEESLSNQEYLYFQFETKTGLIDPRLTEASCAVPAFGNGDSYHLALLISNDSFATYTILSKDIFIEGNPSFYTEKYITTFDGYKLNENSSYELRIYVYGVIDSGSEDYCIWDDLFIRINSGQASDFDLDGYHDHQDLDSDNDGLYDLLEVGGSDINNDGKIGVGVITDSNLNGWSAICDPSEGGTPLIDSNSNGLGLPDRINLDSDGDGCDDVKEAGFPDANKDGELGGVPVSIDAFGRVIYTP